VAIYRLIRKRNIGSHNKTWPSEPNSSVHTINEEKENAIAAKNDPILSIPKDFMNIYIKYPEKSNWQKRNAFQAAASFKKNRIFDG